MLVEFITISKTFSNNFKLQKRSPRSQTSQKHHAASRKMQNAVWQKINWFVVVDKRHAHPGKIKLHHNRPNSLANAAHAASEFRKQRLTFLSINIITKYFALPCKVQKTTKIHRSQMLFHHSAANPELCTKKTCYNQIPRAISSCQGNVAHVHRINGSLYFHMDGDYTRSCQSQTTCHAQKSKVPLSMHLHLIRNPKGRQKKRRETSLQ